MDAFGMRSRDEYDAAFHRRSAKPTTTPLVMVGSTEPRLP